ncbi:MAG: hypothetical protein AAFU79_28375 [Myxococcota bacterium]
MTRFNHPRAGASLTAKHALLFFASTFVALLGFASPAEAKTRSCTGRVRVELKPRSVFPLIWVDIETFSAKGSAPTANGARRKARDKVRACAQTVWNQRWLNHPNGHGIPNECGNFWSVYDFGMTNLKCEIYDAVCALKSAQGRGSGVPDYALIWTKTNGQTGSCTDGVLMYDGYLVPECSASARAAECGT